MIRVEPAKRELLNELYANGESKTRKSTAAVAPAHATNENSRLLNQIAEQIPASELNGFASLVNFSGTLDDPIHRWFRYREGYSTDLVKHFATGLPRGAVILDPFAGAGTTLLAAQQLGYPSVGFDVNPLSTLVARVKTTILPEAALFQIQQHRSNILSLTPSAAADPKPLLKIIDKVFDKEILKALLILRKYINNLEDKLVRDFLFVAWLGILEQVSNIFREGNGIKYKNRKRTGSGYINIDSEAWQNAMFPANRLEFVVEKFIQKLDVMLSDLITTKRTGSPVRIVDDSAERLTQHIPKSSVSLAIFSPPYCNCFNYFKAYKIELWMGGFIKDYDDLRRLTQGSMRSHVEMPLKKASDQPIDYVENFVRLLDGVPIWSNRIPDAIRGYFTDMRVILCEIYAALKPSGRCVIVVGNSSYGGIVIPTDALLAKIGTDLGFRLDKLSVARSLTSSSQQKLKLGDRKDFLRESIVILSKPDPRLEDKTLENIGEIPLSDIARDGKVFAIRNSGLTDYTHKYHRYPGKFIPHVPRWALNRYIRSGHESVVLDPFCGSGTTLVECSLHGANSVGIDIDPIARLVSEVKTTPIAPSRIDLLIKEVSEKIRRRKKSTFRPNIPTLSHWFNEMACNELGIIREVINDYQSSREEYQFLLVCFISVIRRASNADNQTQKTYVSHTHPKSPESGKDLFLKTLPDYANRLHEFTEICPSRKATVLSGGDARNLVELWKTSGIPKIDLVISSPPYLNSVDYVYNQMAEYFWIGDMCGMWNQALQNEHKRHYIGTERFSSTQYRTLPETGIDEIDAICSSIYARNKKNGFITARYFLDMIRHFDEVAQIMKSGAHYPCVIGDSLVSGEAILVHKHLEQCASLAGLSCTSRFGYEIRNRHMRFPRNGRGGLVRYDWVIDLQKE